MSKRTLVSITAGMTMLVPLFVAAQGSEEEGTRQLWNSQFFQKRPAPAGKKAAPPPANIVYKPVGTTKLTPTSSSPGVMETLLGITLWRLRPPKPADDPNSRLLVLVDPSSTRQDELVPERVDIETPLSKNDKVRLTVEVPRTGYLYVIDREQYADGTTSPAYLIYPNHRTRQGDNAVAAGRVIEVPDQRDFPNHFTILPTKPNQVAELLSMLVTPEPLEGIDTSKRSVQIPDEQLADWQKKFGVQAERFELTGGAGTAYSGVEKKAGSSGQTKLTQADPMPQTLYRVPAADGKAILLNVPVKIKK
jgi:hypothetical protein